MKLGNLCLLGIAGLSPCFTPLAFANEAELKAQIEALTKKVEALEAHDKEGQGKQESAPKKPDDAKEAASGKDLFGVGSFPGSFRIPGTDTSVKLGGYVKLDVVKDFDGGIGTSTANYNLIPLDRSPQSRRKGQVNITARESRFNIDTRTPSSFGEVRAFIEGDFYGATGDALTTNSGGFRLRQAYVAVDHFLLGQTFSNFNDLEGTPETVEFNGPLGIETGLRQAQARYTTKIGKGDFSVAVENPQGDFFGSVRPTFVTAGSAISTNELDQAPDVTLRYIYRDSWGHVSVSGVARLIEDNTGGVPVAGFKGRASSLAGGGSLVVQLNSFDRDKLTIHFLGGPGIGRYLNDSNGGQSSVIRRNDLIPVTSIGGNVSYQRVWSDTLRSNFIVGANRYFNPHPELPLTVNRRLESATANILWNPLAKLTLGLEYLYGDIKVDSPSTAALSNEGSASRVQFGAKLAF